MLDLDRGPVLLPGEPLDGSGDLEPYLGRAMRRAMEIVGSMTPAELERTHKEVIGAFGLGITPGVARDRFAVHLLAALACDPSFDEDDALRSDLPPESRLVRRFPEIEGLLTDERLLRIEPETRADGGGVAYLGHVLHYHPLLPLSRSDDPKHDLVPALLDLARRPGVRVAVALDHRRFTPADKHRRWIMFDHWYGRPFRRRDLDDPHAVGLTVHAAPALSKESDTSVGCFLAGIIRTEFLWTHKQGVKTVQVEEVVSGGRSRPRFVHSLRDVAAQRFTHLDGAVMEYADPAAREASKLPSTPRARRKPKLFRIDGPLSADDWALVTSLFFRANPLIHEYLGEAPREVADR